jgi:hypothetical protein
MRTECLNHKFVYETPMQTGRLVTQVADSILIRHCASFHCCRVSSAYTTLWKKTVWCRTVGHWFWCKFVCNMTLTGCSKQVRICMKLLLLATIMITKLRPLVPDHSLLKLILKRTSFLLRTVRIGYKFWLILAASLDELIKHGLTALSETIQSSSEGLNTKNCSVGIVGENLPFQLIEGAKLQPYVSLHLLN